MTDVTIDVRAVLLRINRQYESNLSPEQLYERTRGYWAMAPELHPNVEYGIAIAGGVIREVYRIDAWAKIATDEIPPNPLRNALADSAPNRSRQRWYFTGRIADEPLRSRLIGQTFTHNDRNPVLFVNC